MNTTDEYRIHLNFFPIVSEIPRFEICRRLVANPQEDRPEGDDVRRYSLPREAAETENRAHYWVVFRPREGFEPFYVEPSYNNHLTVWALFKGIGEQCKVNLAPEDFWLSQGGFLREIHFNMRPHKEGNEQLVVQPYRMRATRKFGVLADFHFRMKDEVRFSRRVQQLSLSLDERFRRNLDFYVDRIEKITEFLEERREVVSAIHLPGAKEPVMLARDSEGMPAASLRPRSYVFKGGHESRSQFMGLKDNGPLRPLSESPNLVFVFRERDRQTARMLAAALKGSTKRERFSFPGFESLFKTPIGIDRDPIVVPDFSTDSMTIALERMEQKANTSIPVLIIPDDEEEGYLNHKALFTHAGLPSQVCTVGVIQDENSLKWSVANIALQIFCKAGGWPWKVRPAGDRSLIIGISQSHKLRKTEEETVVERYSAFSILTDSSGLFQKLQVLGESENENTYLDQLRKNLKQVLTAGADEFSRVVIHTSFKLKQHEITAIQKVVQEAALQTQNGHCQFAVVKVNHKSRFFGANRNVNSLVPFEGTRVKLGHCEYLVWFEGIFPDKPTVTKAFPGPTHLQFLSITDDNRINDEILLQDLVNLSGANWRGFNAKSAPVSIFYCQLVADLVHDCQQRGLPLPAVNDLRPWFL
ncbi:MAG: Piwi domain-containing protein [Opitutaceae bacterium]